MSNNSNTLRDLGWSPFFQSQVGIDEIGQVVPVRVAAMHRAAFDALSETGMRRTDLPADMSASEVTVGDWVLCDVQSGVPVRLLERSSLLQRRGAGTGHDVQLIAANVDTLFVVSSCNADFNPARIERYLVLAHQAGVVPVLVLTKADVCDDPGEYLDAASRISPDLVVEVINARDPVDTGRLLPWCGRSQTVAFVGSSGVGKSTLVNRLTGAGQATQGIREDDAKGRHTTTARTLHPIAGGGWLVDTPGMRELRLHDAGDGLAEVFSDIVDLAEGCRFGDCAHESEPGCAVLAAIAAGELDSARLDRWRKLEREEAHNVATALEQRRLAKTRERHYRSGKARGREKRGD